MRKYYLLLPLLLASVMMWAAPVSREAAQQRAKEFLSARHPGHARRTIRAASNPSALKPASQEAYYHVFNIGDGDGFVIVSGDDRTTPVIGYTDSGTFDEQTLPVNVRAWLNDYAEKSWSVPDGEAEVLLAKEHLNTIRHLNHFFRDANAKLKQDGYFFCAFDTAQKRRAQIFSRYPKFIAYIIYFIGFINIFKIINIFITYTYFPQTWIFAYR